MKTSKKLVYGVGINDSSYSTSWMVGDKRVTCPFYKAWRGMLMRCHDSGSLERNPKYRECSISEEWYSFMCFRSWMQTQDWEGKQLDKDLLVKGNKMYSKDTCIFLSAKLNSFLTDSQGRKNKSLPGTYKDKGRYRSCCYGADGEALYLGMFDLEEDAHKAYLAAKGKVATELASRQIDKRVSDALAIRFRPDI